MSKPLISYAQNFEDVMLWRAVGGAADGFFVDIGGQDPVVDSVSRLFHEHGWHGIHVEPHPDYSEALRRAYADDVVIASAVGAARDVLPYYRLDGTGLSTLSQKIAEGHSGKGFKVSKSQVSVVTLDDVFSIAGDREIHWLKIDVEGFEQQVLEGWQKSPLRPWIIVLESTLPTSRSENYAAWEDLVLCKGYQFAYGDGLNRFYVSDTHPELAEKLNHPPNLFDGFQLSGTSSSSFHLYLAHQGDQRQQELEQAFTLKLQSLKSENEALQKELSARQVSLEAQRALYHAQSQRHQDRLQDTLASLVKIERTMRGDLEQRWDAVRQEYTQAIKERDQRLQSLQEDLRWLHADTAVKVRSLTSERQHLSDQLAQAHSEYQEQIHALEQTGAQKEVEFLHQLEALRQAQQPNLGQLIDQASNHLQSALVQLTRQANDERLATNLHHQARLDEVQQFSEAHRERAEAAAAELEEARDHLAQSRAETSTVRMQLAELQCQLLLANEQALANEREAARLADDIERTRTAAALTQRAAERERGESGLRELRWSEHLAAAERGHADQVALLLSERARLEVELQDADANLRDTLARHDRTWRARLAAQERAHGEMRADWERERTEALSNAQTQHLKLEQEREIQAAERLRATEQRHQDLLLQFETLIESVQQDRDGFQMALNDAARQYSALRNTLARFSRMPWWERLRWTPDADPIGSSEHIVAPMSCAASTNSNSISQHSLVAPSAEFLDQPMPMNATDVEQAEIHSVNDLLGLDDEAFVRAAYANLLCRVPDPLGYADFVQQIRRGVSKEFVIVAMANSKEGRHARPQLSGLEVLIQQHAALGSRILARWRGWRQAPLNRLDSGLRSLDNKLARLLHAQADHARRLNRLETLSQNIAAMGSQIDLLRSDISTEHEQAAAFRAQADDQLAVLRDALKADSSRINDMEQALESLVVQTNTVIDHLAPKAPPPDPRNLALDAARQTIGVRAKLLLGDICPPRAVVDEERVRRVS